MKTFQEFMLIAESTYDASFMSGAQIIKTGEGGRIGQDRRKTAPEKTRVKAIGGGKTAPAKPYKTRKDAGQQKGSSAAAPGRPAKSTELKPGTAGTQGSAAMTAKERQRKAFLERKARESGKEQPKTPSQALSQAKPGAKPAAEKKPKPAPSGKTRAERDKERNAALRAKYNAEKQKALAGYKEVHGSLPKGKERTKLLAAVQKAHAPHPSGTLK